jgi:hypothetical protein
MRGVCDAEQFSAAIKAIMPDRDLPRRFAFRRFADQCRELSKTAANPEVVVQLQQWAVECDRKADLALRVSAPRKDDLLEQARRHRMKAEEHRVVGEQMRDRNVCASFRRLAETYEAMARRLETRAEQQLEQEVG